MSFCDYFKQYIHDPADSIRDKHVFYRTDDWYDEVKNTEQDSDFFLQSALRLMTKDGTQSMLWGRRLLIPCRSF